MPEAVQDVRDMSTTSRAVTIRLRRFKHDEEIIQPFSDTVWYWNRF